MDQDRLLAIWRSEEQQPFIGWDFSYLDGRMLEEQPPWSYSTRAAELLRQASSVVDMGTGGGERFLKLRSAWPARVAVTEEYPPNYRLATERLGPLGVQVVQAALNTYTPMPFADGEFDLVLNRHSGFNWREVARILAPKGVFFTQQVDGLWAQDLLAEFGVKPQWPDSTLANNVARLLATGLAIVMGLEWSGKFAFTDVGAIVYYLKSVPWLVPGFSVATHLDALLRLQDRLNAGDQLVFRARKYLIEARKES